MSRSGPVVPLLSFLEDQVGMVLLEVLVELLDTQLKSWEDEERQLIQRVGDIMPPPTPAPEPEPVKEKVEGEDEYFDCNPQHLMALVRKHQIGATIGAGISGAGAGITALMKSGVKAKGKGNQVAPVRGRGSVHAGGRSDSETVYLDAATNNGTSSDR